MFPDIRHQLDLLKKINRIVALGHFLKNTCLLLEHNNMILIFILIGLIRFSIKNINTEKNTVNRKTANKN